VKYARPDLLFVQETAFSVASGYGLFDSATVQHLVSLYEF
jgi:hypothetical protein